MEPGGDLRAPGAAITVALCGHWEHEPPCPLAPHHTDAQRSGEQRSSDQGSGDQVQLRVLFAADPAAEAEVRGRIDAALAAGAMTGPDGVASRWQLACAQPGVLRAGEAAHAERLIQG